MNRMRYAGVVLLVIFCALAAGCNMSLFSDRHYHYHNKCGPLCRHGEPQEEPGIDARTDSPERTEEE
jgi:hypothetical protein